MGQMISLIRRSFLPVMKPHITETDAKMEGLPMKSKDKQRQSPPLRNKKGNRRECTIQCRVTKQETKHGKNLSRVIRATACGGPLPKSTALNKHQMREIMHALHAHYVETERMYNLALLGLTEEVSVCRKDLEKTYKYLTMLCISDFSK
jgi:hypothetical protein